MLVRIRWKTIQKTVKHLQTESTVTIPSDFLSSPLRELGSAAGHFADKGTEAVRQEMICPRSPNWDAHVLHTAVKTWVGLS